MLLTHHTTGYGVIRLPIKLTAKYVLLLLLLLWYTEPSTDWPEIKAPVLVFLDGDETLSSKSLPAFVRTSTKIVCRMYVYFNLGMNLN